MSGYPNGRIPAHLRVLDGLRWAGIHSPAKRRILSRGLGEELRLNNFCLIAVRNEERYLPGFLHHIRDHLDGILALDDCSTDATADILKRDPRVISILREENHGPPHANETKNRNRLLDEAARLNAGWVLCADADERFEEAFLRRIPEHADRGARTGQHVRCVRIVNLWNAPNLYRVDGLCGPRWAPRMFKMPKQFTKRAFGLHRPWFPPELDNAPKAYMNAYLYHLRMIERDDREARFEKFRSVDPNNEHQGVGYRHMIDETNLKLMPVLPGRRYTDGANDGSRVRTVPKPAVGPAGLSVLPAEAEFDEWFYLSQYRDVRNAVAQGFFTAGWQHFKRYGASEGRQWRRKASLRGFDFETIFGEWRDRKSSPH
ncbi:MAG: glycosyltransferase family 2 protein [Alphaproteobacteria bacterium]